MASTNQFDINLFGEKVELPRIDVFHDESGVFGCSRWCLTGLAWCKHEVKRFLVDKLMDVRESHKYWGEIHYCELPARFEGVYSTDARVARDWLNLYITNLSYCMWFNVLAVDTQHEMYDAKRFGHKFHAYNRFSALALYGGVKWHFLNNSQIRVALFSDEKVRRPGSCLGDGVNTDNFEEYIMKRLSEDTRKDKKCPCVDFELPIKLINIPQNRRKEDIKDEEELLQLCDLLLGAVYSAITSSSNTEVKTWLGKTIAPLIADTRREPWNQDFKLHRRFSVSYSPDIKGSIYSDGQLAIKDDTSQLRLFD